MENKNTIGCRAGRAKIVDPNDFDGFKSSDNVPVQLEDLNISVKLTSFRKARTLLTTEKEGGIKQNVSQISVNFIEGIELGGGEKKVLTTSYTDLTTTFDSDIVNDETLGITNIDIEFNASMAPMITINFIDVRGSSIFQNEENILNNKGNKYTTFFQLPYPMFELEIKGYYGFPVKYCLHMLKFNSKFNSQTGNFEITANFVGYTFALMSDMLIGYLKAIPFTTIGGDRMTNYNSTFTNGKTVPTLSELSVAISRLNSAIDREASENPASQIINAVTTSNEQLDGIKNQINILGQNLDLNGEKDEYQYIVFNSVATYTASQKTAKDLYDTQVKKLIGEFNELNANNKLEEIQFIGIEVSTNSNGGKKYKNITIEGLSPTSNDATIKLNLGNPSNVTEVKEKILNHINNYNKVSNIGPKASIDILDMSLLFEKLGKTKKDLEVASKEAKTTLAKAFETQVKKELGFDPTARSIIESYTAAIEVFVETIFLVSQAASKTTNTVRTAELAKKFKNDDEANKITDIGKENIAKQEFYPWPDYREFDAEKKAYVDKYLGAAGVLDVPGNVDELVFIDDLLLAFRKAAKKEQEALANAEILETTWNSVSPYDTFLFTDVEPYVRAGDLTTTADVARLMVIRAMIFLGYSNDMSILSDEEIIGMAVAEVNNMLRSVKDAVLRQALTQLNVEFFQGAAGFINGTDRKVLGEDGTNLYYNYIYQTGGKAGFKLLPLNKKFGIPKNKDTWGDPANDPTVIKTLFTERDELDNYFLTNYSDAYKDATTGTVFKKPDDGGLYVQILGALPDTKTLATVPEGVPTETKMVLSELTPKTSPTSAAGYNSFNPNYGVQEYKDMDWGNKDLDGLPLMYVFYRDCDSGLALTRAASKNAQSLKYDTTSPFMYNVYPIIEWPNGKEEAYETGYVEKDGDHEMTDKKMHSDLGINRKLFNDLLNGGSGSSITYPYIELKYDYWDGVFGTDDEPRQPYTDFSFSLFGSRLYYEQSYSEIVKNNNSKISSSDYSRALLFLNTLPFNVNQSTADPFTKGEIKHLFDMKAGIIHAPRLWCAYIGSILWRLDKSDPELDGDGKITGGGSGKKDPIVWSYDYANGDINNLDEDASVWDIPVIKQSGKKDQFFPSVLDMDGSSTNLFYKEHIIKDLSPIKTLPVQVKNEFKKIFFEFVNGEGGKVTWKDLANKLEIFKTDYKDSGKDFTNYLKAVLNLDKIVGGLLGGVGTNTAKIVSGFSGVYAVKSANIKAYYDIITPINASKSDFYLFLELKDGYGTNDAVTSIIDAMSEEIFIINNSPTIWKAGESFVLTERAPIEVDSAKFNIYFSAVTETLKSKADEYNISKQNENIDISLFGTANKDIIKIQLYRNCKNIYDKWLGGAEDVDHLVFQCGDSRSSIDKELATKYGNDKVRMIDSFRFVSRNFRDIGDSLYINPIPINNMLIGNPNSAAYDGISQILAANNFNFQALPNFINFHDDKVLESIFKPYNYGEQISSGSCGPAFVCVYAGQSSKHLDVKEGNYPNDGFDMRCMTGDQTKGSMDVTVPPDFTDSEAAKYEDPIGTFTVKYSQQNQSIFKDINLDQSEFSETDESLQVQDEISQKGSENNRSIVGQNIYNVYAVRSYTAQIEMMGNAMIQPMMYFQLDNIPMFHGAYLITKVSHSIRPNSMSTNFSGTRIRYPETPLISAYEVYMDLLETLDLSEAGTEGGTSGSGGGGSSSVNGKFAPIIGTIVDNGGFNGKIVAGNIKTAPLPKIEGLANAKLENKAENQLLAEAVDPFVKMMKEYIKWLIAEGFPGHQGYQIDITSMFRDYAKQVAIKAEYGSAAATPGSSNHGWGIAIDLQFYNKQGGQIKNTKNTTASFKFTNNPAIKWLYDNSYRFGWVFPVSLRDSKPLEEHWHIEYHGTAAKCIMEKNPTIYGYTVKVDKAIDSSVKNPKTPDGKEAVYTNCDFVYKKKEADGEDGSDNNKNTTQTSDAESEAYFKLLLKKLGAPSTAGNLIWFKAWRQMEGAKATWNAFNSTQKINDSTRYNSVGVQNYKTMEDGVTATYNTLTNGKYPNIVKALKTGIVDKAAALSLAIELQKTGKDLCIWVKGPKGCAEKGGIPASQYIASCLKYNVSGNNVYKPK